MTLLISILAITNMAIGYGLAIYLGQSRAPVQITLGRLRKSKKSAAAPLPKKATQEEASTAPAEDELPAQPEYTEPLPPQVPQLDVNDLMADAQPGQDCS